MTNVLLYVATVLIWGSTWLAIKFQLGVVAPEVSVAYRFLLAAAILFAWGAWRRVGFSYPMRAHLRFALLGFLLFSTNYLLFYFATARLTTGLIAVVFSTIVAWNIVNGRLVFGRRSETRVKFGAALGFLGICIVFWPELKAFDLARAGTVGLLLSVVATYSASLGNMVSAHLQVEGYPILQGNAWGMLYGALMQLTFALARGIPFAFDPSPAYMGSLLYLAVFGSVIGFGCYLTLLGRIGADRAGYAAVLFPVVALCLSTLFEDFSWTYGAYLGVVLIMLGNVLVLGRLKRGIIGTRTATQ